MEKGEEKRTREEWTRGEGERERARERGLDGWEDGKEEENRETLWSGTRCSAGIRSGPHEASLAFSERVHAAAESTRPHGAARSRLKEQFNTIVDILSPPPPLLPVNNL